MSMIVKPTRKAVAIATVAFATALGADTDGTNDTASQAQGASVTPKRPDRVYLHGDHLELIARNSQSTREV